MHTNVSLTPEEMLWLSRFTGSTHKKQARRWEEMKMSEVHGGEQWEELFFSYTDPLGRQPSVQLDQAQLSSVTH